MQDAALPDRLVKAISAYVAMRGRDRPVSIKRVVSSSRYLMPDLPLSDEDLADRILEHLVSMNCDIDFDTADSALLPLQEDARSSA